MAVHLLERTGAVPRIEAERAVLVAALAWNQAVQLELTGPRRESVTFQWSGTGPVKDLESPDNDRLVAQLVEYKRARWPRDGRLVVAVEVGPGGLRVQWMDAAGAASTASAAPIAPKVLAGLNAARNNKVADIGAAIRGRAAADELQRTVVKPEQLAGMHPAHAAYVYAQNQAAVLSEQLTALPEMAPLADLVAKAEDLYWPGGPPMSPLTRSYFTCWALFDACLEPTGETIGTTILAVGKALGMDPALLRFVELMQASRMGFHVQEGREGDLVVLRELVTGRICRAVAASGYQGRKGDLWFARVLPPPSAGGSEHVVFTTPYIVRRPGLSEWEAYFRRSLPLGDRLEAYERHMKFGPSRSYWNEYVFEAYTGHDAEAVFLAGLPDVPESRPHSEASRRSGW
jgi:hypothetical protein